MKKDFNRLGKVPHTIKEGVYITPSINKVYYFCDSVSPSSSFIDSTIYEKEWYSFLHNHDLLGNYILDMYKDKPFNSIIDDYCEPFSNGSYNDSDTVDLFKQIQYKAIRVYYKNVHKYDKLWEALTVEFNPLWNVDGVEKTVRLLQKEGTEKNEHKGKDTLKKRGEEKNEKNGDDTLTKGGSEITEDRGNDKVKHDGYTNTIDSGKEINTKTGSRDNTRTGGETTIKSEATTDSQSFLNVEREVKQYSDNNLLDYVKDSETFNQYADTTEFQSREKRNNLNTTDTTQYGKTETKRFDEYEEKQNYDSSNTLSFTNREDEQNYDSYSELSFDDRKDRETTTYERHGNIGVTTTTQLLTEYVEYAKLVDFVDIVARDILETITVGVY
jgi:hypothetical protein